MYISLYRSALAVSLSSIVLISISVSGKTVHLKEIDVLNELRTLLNSGENNLKIVIPGGKFDFDRSLNVVGENISLVGKGSDKTVLDFSEQKRGAEAISARGSGLIFKSMEILNPMGDGLVVRHSRDVNISDVRVIWDKNLDRSPGGYGIYPVASYDVVIKSSYVFGAAEAGIYLGQTVGGIIDGNSVESNVAGIHVENSEQIVIRQNKARNNSIGVLIAAIPDLPRKRTSDILITKNILVGNNGKNFSFKGSLVNGLPNGVGVFLLAGENIRIKDNSFTSHTKADIFAASYFYYQSAFGDGRYNPYLRGVATSNNLWSSKAYKGPIDINQIASVHIHWDGVVPPASKNPATSSHVLCISEKSELYTLSDSTEITTIANCEDEN